MKKDYQKELQKKMLKKATKAKRLKVRFKYQGY